MWKRPLVVVKIRYLVISFTFSQTNVSGILSQHTAWTLKQGPYGVIGNVLKKNTTSSDGRGIFVNGSDIKIFDILGEQVAWLVYSMLSAATFA